MAFEGRIVLFVEGSSAPARRGRDPLATIWQDLLVNFLGLLSFERVVPISKTNLVAMNPDTPRSGRAVPLDELIARELEREAFEVAVVAWDLVPAWNPESELCRWTETL